MRQVFKVSADEGQDPLFSFGDGNVTARYDVEVRGAVEADPTLTEKNALIGLIG